MVLKNEFYIGKQNSSIKLTELITANVYRMFTKYVCMRVNESKYFLVPFLSQMDYKTYAWTLNIYIEVELENL